MATMAAMSDPDQVWGYAQNEPAGKRQRIEQLPATSYFGTDGINSTADILDPQWEISTNYQQGYNQTYEGPAWSLNSTARRPFYDPVADSGPEYSISNDFSSEFEGSISWSVPSIYESNVHSQPEQLRVDEDFFRPQFVGNFQTSPNYEEPIRSNNSFNAPALEDFGEQLDNRHMYQPNNIVNTVQQEETSRVLHGDRDVCFGMIADVPVISNQPATLDIDTASIPLRLCPPNDLFHVDSNETFGQLEDRTAKIFVSIEQHKGINFEIHCRSVVRAAIPGKKTTKKGAAQRCQYLMNVVIFGPADLGDVVGKYFTKCRMYLQDPRCDRDAVYLNPHLLAEENHVVMTSSFSNSDTVADVENMISEQDLFSKLSSDDHLCLTEAPEEVQTPLYDHQKKALSFMMKREQGWECNGSTEDLWAKEVDETGQLMYTNTITDLSQKQQPPDCRGGLLADQMGLGKTLTVISLIALNPSVAREPIKFTAQGSLKCIKSTLIVVPFTLLKTWETQLSRHLKPNTLKWTRLHGPRKRKALSLGYYDIVITTFETLVRQRKKHLENKPDTLFSFSWYRIVLDEAHTIRNRATSMANACCEVDATSRWAMTGTPIQNRITDLGSLLEFLKVYPFSNPKIFDSEIIKPWLKSSAQDISRLKRLINCTSLCRTKSIINLPKRENKIYNLDFSPAEREYYEQKKESAIQQFDNALSSCPPKPGQYINALQRLNELRLICNHGTSHSKRKQNEILRIPQASSAWTKDIADKAFETLVCAGDAVCSVCCDTLTSSTSEASSAEHSKPTLTSCLNLTCGSCLHDVRWGKHVPKCFHTPPCPSREVSFAPETVVGQAVQLPSVRETSTKLKALMQSLLALNGEKSVVFSYWTYTLDLVEALLIKAGVEYTRIDGERSGEKREQANTRFQEDPSIMVILVSISCGGAGLDLTAASRAYLLEPQWNPQMEEQALSRIHRLGQTKEVTTIRYRIRNSYEEKVVKTQEEKKDLAASAFSGERHQGGRDATRRLQELYPALRD